MAAFYSLVTGCKVAHLLDSQQLEKFLPPLAPWFLHRTPEFLEERPHLRFELLPDHTESRNAVLDEQLPKAMDELCHLVDILPLSGCDDIKKSADAIVKVFQGLKNDWINLAFGTR